MQTRNQIAGSNGDRTGTLLRRRVSRRSGFRTGALVAMAVLLLGSSACGGGDDDEEDEEDEDD